MAVDSAWFSALSIFHRTDVHEPGKAIAMEAGGFFSGTSGTSRARAAGMDLRGWVEVPGFRSSTGIAVRSYWVLKREPNAMHPEFDDSKKAVGLVLALKRDLRDIDRVSVAIIVSLCA